MSNDAAFREALAKLCAVYARNFAAWGAYDDEVDALRARVLALYAERQGEVYEVDRAEGKYMQLWRTLPERWEATLKPGDRVRVVRCEVGMYDPKNDPPTGGAK